jgi:DNA mismatch endonuclease (patch repair protein)
LIVVELVFVSVTLPPLTRGISAVELSVFVDGCFWAACPEHGSIPRSNVGYWVPKLARNLDRDPRVDQALRAHGWIFVRVWEHEPPEDASIRILELVRGADYGETV